MKYKFTRKELKAKKASDFKDGDAIECSCYIIFIKYGEYKRPSLCSYIERIDCRPFRCSVETRPYYIDDFIGR
jgi:hypothetical protein